MNELGNSVSPSLDAAEVDRELAALRQRIDESVAALDELASIQSQFANLARTYRQYEEAIATLETEASGELAKVSQVYEERLAAVERELGTVELHVGDDISQQMMSLRSDIEQRIGTLEQHAEARARAVEEFKHTLHTRLETWFKEHGSFDATQEQEEKLQRLAHEFVQTRTSHRRLKRQVRILRVGFGVGGIILAIMAIGHLMPLIPQGTVDPNLVEEGIDAVPLPEEEVIEQLP